jgi:3-oxoacyl-[acyl-carrier-protein] synthase III
MIGICNIATYIPENRINNLDRKKEFNISDDFIVNKLGVQKVSRKRPNENTSDLCCTVYQKLLENTPQFDPQNIDVIAVTTQNPDFGLPHTAAIVHGKLGLSESCAAFDISLGCSGYVYGLSILESFMKASNMKSGLLFTADPYSKIIDPTDKSTSLLFGDAASVTYIGENPLFSIGKFSFGTQGKGYAFLINRQGTLSMNGREIFNFSARKIPEDIKKVLELNHLGLDQIDRFLLHQGSKYIVDFIARRLGIPRRKVPYVIENYGNTVSSSIPIMLQDILPDPAINRILLSGFGVGLSWASGILTRT